MSRRINRIYIPYDGEWRFRHDEPTPEQLRRKHIITPEEWERRRAGELVGG